MARILLSVVAFLGRLLGGGPSVGSKRHPSQSAFPDNSLVSIEDPSRR
jgi:hypothetical protein